MNLLTNLGAIYLGNNLCRFLVWAPAAQTVTVHIVSPEDRSLPLRKDDKGYHHGSFKGINSGSLYFYQLDGKDFPDPASRFQPEGVHGPSQVVASDFAWEDQLWAGIPLQEYVVYELHVGSYSANGTFDGVIPFLDYLKELGVTAVEVMPVAQFPGERNWGYDGAYPFAVQNSYGDPEALKRLVSTCHKKRMAVVLDVVYNHLGPEGNYFKEFGPYFTDRYRTPWGMALNFDGAGSDEVRRFFIENALYWLTEFHIDALRLDALHTILDFSPKPFLEELTESVNQLRKQLDRHIYLIGESDANDRRLITSPELGGYGLDAQWNDDFHHCVHVLLTGEKAGYYNGFGQTRQLAKAFREGFVYSGEYSPFRKRRHGSSSKDIPADHFVVFAQNHDQVGNRMLGERLSQLVPFEGLKLAAGAVLLSPFIPLLFMGEEYGETAPFLYFTSHADPALVAAVRNGRCEEFTAFRWQGEPPDPQMEKTFIRSKPDHDLHKIGHHAVLLQFYKELIRLRQEIPALSSLSKDNLDVIDYEEAKALCVRRWHKSGEALIVFNFSSTKKYVTPSAPEGHWQKKLDSGEKQWLGEGSELPQEFVSGSDPSLALGPQSFVLLIRSQEAK